MMDEHTHTPPKATWVKQPYAGVPNAMIEVKNVRFNLLETVKRFALDDQISNIAIYENVIAIASDGGLVIVRLADFTVLAWPSIYDPDYVKNVDLFTDAYGRKLMRLQPNGDIHNAMTPRIVLF